MTLPLRVPGRGRAELRVISGRRRFRPRRALVWALYTLGAIVAFLALIYFRTAVDESAYRIRHLQDQIEVEEARRHQLHLEKIRLESPGEIVPIAEQMLGMVLPEDVVPISGDPERGWPETGAHRTPDLEPEG